MNSKGAVIAINTFGVFFNGFCAVLSSLHREFWATPFFIVFFCINMFFLYATLEEL